MCVCVCERERERERGGGGEGGWRGRGRERGGGGGTYYEHLYFNLDLKGRSCSFPLKLYISPPSESRPTKQNNNNNHNNKTNMCRVESSPKRYKRLSRRLMGYKSGFTTELALIWFIALIGLNSFNSLTRLSHNSWTLTANSKQRFTTSFKGTGKRCSEFAPRAAFLAFLALTFRLLVTADEDLM